MTAEELARIRPPLCCGNHETLVARLLEERERLLEALRAAHAFADRTCRGTGWNENGPALRERLGAAIAFAEAPTSKEGT